MLERILFLKTFKEQSISYFIGIFQLMCDDFGLEYFKGSLLTGLPLYRRAAGIQQEAEGNSCEVSRD